METRGMVVKIKGRSCIVLTPEGEYREVPLPGGGAIRVGQEIPLKRRKSLPYLKHFMVAASLLIFILAGQLALWQTPPAAAYLTIDINPSVELAVSSDGKVISGRGLNSDGEKILAKVKIKKRDLREAVKLIVAQAMDDQYLGGTDSNLILATLTVDSDTEPVVDLESVYEAIKSPVASGGLDAEVIIEPVKPEMRQEAARAGISAGRYLLLRKSEEKGVPVTISEISTQNIGKLEKEKKVSFIKLVEADNNEDQEEPMKEKEHNDVKRGIYIEHSTKENAGGKRDGEVFTNGGKQQDSDHEKKNTPGGTVKKMKEEQLERSEQHNNTDVKRKIDDNGRSDRSNDRGRGDERDSYNRKSHDN